MKRHFIWLLLAAVSLTATAQDKLLTLTDAASMNPRLFPRGLSRLQWVDGMDWYSYMAKRDSMVVVDAGSGDVVRSITLNQLNEWMSWQDSLKTLPVSQVARKGATHFLCC